MDLVGRSRTTDSDCRTAPSCVENMQKQIMNERFVLGERVHRQADRHLQESRLAVHAPPPPRPRRARCGLPSACWTPRRVARRSCTRGRRGVGVLAPRSSTLHRHMHSRNVLYREQLRHPTDHQGRRLRLRRRTRARSPSRAAAGVDWLGWASSSEVVSRPLHLRRQPPQYGLPPTELYKNILKAVGRLASEPAAAPLTRAPAVQVPPLPRRGFAAICDLIKRLLRGTPRRGSAAAPTPPSTSSATPSSRRSTSGNSRRWSSIAARPRAALGHRHVVLRRPDGRARLPQRARVRLQRQRVGHRLLSAECGVEVAQTTQTARGLAGLSRSILI